MRRNNKSSIVTIEDLLDFSGAVSHSGKVYSEVRDEVLKLNDEEVCFGMFLTNIENDMIEEKIDFSKLKAKNEEEIKNYLQGRMESIINRYINQYNIDVEKMIGKEYFVIDTSKNFDKRFKVSTFGIVSPFSQRETA